MMEAPRTILFLCPHNAAKSLLAAADCRAEAERRGLVLNVVNAGTEPADAPAPAVVEALQADGIDVSGHRPRRVTTEELAAAWRIVSMGCDPKEFAAYTAKLERWDEIPAASQDLAASRTAIRAHVARFLDRAADELRGAGAVAT